MLEGLIMILGTIYPPAGANPWIYIPMVIIVFLILLIVGIRSGSIFK